MSQPHTPDVSSDGCRQGSSFGSSRSVNSEDGFRFEVGAGNGRRIYSRIKEQRLIKIVYLMLFSVRLVSDSLLFYAYPRIRMRWCGKLQHTFLACRLKLAGKILGQRKFMSVASVVAFEFERVFTNAGRAPSCRPRMPRGRNRGR